MATLRNKRKLAAVSRETPEGSRSSRGRNVLDPELTQDYISQVSEEIEGSVTKKLSKEVNKTESRILGALSKLDEFHLNSQVRTCSVAAHGTSRNSNSENRETHGDRSSNDTYPEVGYFPHHSGQLNSPETETNSHLVTETYPHSPTITEWLFLVFFLRHFACLPIVPILVHTVGMFRWVGDKKFPLQSFLVVWNMFLTTVPFAPQKIFGLFFF